MEIEENFTGSTSLFRFFEKYPTGISVSRNHVTGTSGYGNHKIIKDFTSCKVDTFLKQFKKSTDIISTTIQNFFAHCGFKHSDLEIP
jgi:hypothetical protein